MPQQPHFTSSSLNQNSLETTDIVDILDKINSFVSVADMGPVPTAPVALTDYSDSESLKSKGFGNAQIFEIQRGLEQGIDVTRFAKPEYNWMQMRELRIGLALNIDITKYENPMFSAMQMREIRFGLVTFVDVDAYAKLYLSVTDMKEIRRKLFTKSYKLNPNQYGRTVYDDITGILVHFSDDCLKAYITVPTNPVSEITRDKIMNILEERNIVYGIHYDMIDKILEQNIRDKEVCIATGKYPLRGNDGWFELNFDNGPDHHNFIQPDDVIDYTSVNTVETVTPGQMLVRYHPAETEVSGMTVYGIEIEGVPGTELPKLSGNGFVYNADSRIYSATRKGYPSFNGVTGSLNIWDVYQINGDISYFQSVEYDGTIHVHGNVGASATVRATGDIIVDGYVEGATLHSDHDIVIKGGVNSGGKGIIYCGGSLRGKFFENAHLEAKGFVEGNYFLNCDIITDERVVAHGKKARIMGGHISAAISVEAVTIGNYLGFRTVFVVGDIAELEQRLLELNKLTNTLTEQIEQLQTGKDQLELLLGSGGVESNALYQKTMTALEALIKQKEDSERETARLTSICTRADNAYVKVHGELQEGVVLIINGNKKTIAKTIRGITLTKEKTRGR